MLRRTLVSLIALSAALLFMAGTSHAQSDDDYASQCSITVIPTNPHAGDTVTVNGTNFPTSPSSVAIKIGNTDVGTAHIDSNGEFSEPVTVPSGLSGTQTVSVACASTDVDATTNINVQANQQSTQQSTQSSSTAPGGAPLARTGTNSTQPLVLAGLGALAVGTALVLTARRRRAGNTAA
jgi:LPXTG-motif cell wall-anchored protein